MTTLDHVIATHQSEWVSFNEEPLFPVPSEGGPKEHLPGASSSSDQSESSSGEHHALDGGSQDLSHSEHDDSSEKLGLISEAASPPGSPEQRPPELVSAISSWVQFEDDAPWASSSPPPKEAGGQVGQVRGWGGWDGGLWMLSQDTFPREVSGLPGFC
uniref:Stonin-2 N-terminal domain-containing protein n=1 Tax=Bos mutus grunniens TaxID=30521 RepID=A0A8B9XW51_BOSMU